MAKTIDIFVIQPLDRCVSADNKDNCEGYLANILTYYKYNGAFTVQDTDDFVRQISAMVRKSDGAKIKTLVIGSHGRDGRDGYFRIGNDVIDAFSVTELHTLKTLAPYFSQDADVFIMACKVGGNQRVLQKVSEALGGVRVHGYTANIITTEESVDDGTRDGGKHVVCMRSNCANTDQRLPARKPSPAEIQGAEAAQRRFEQTHGRF